MIDFTKIELNPLPPPIVELRTENIALQDKNKVLQVVLICGGVLLGLYLLNRMVTSKNEEDEQ